MRRICCCCKHVCSENLQLYCACVKGKLHIPGGHVWKRLYCSYHCLKWSPNVSLILCHGSVLWHKPSHNVFFPIFISGVWSPSNFVMLSLKTLRSHSSTPCLCLDFLRSRFSSSPCTHRAPLRFLLLLSIYSKSVKTLQPIECQVSPCLTTLGGGFTTYTMSCSIYVLVWPAVTCTDIFVFTVNDHIQTQFS